MTENKSNLLTVQEAAAMLGRTVDQVRAMIHSGELLAARTGRGYLIQPLDVERIIARQKRTDDTPTRN